METNQRIYFPDLHVLRFFAFLAIFFLHSFFTENTEIQSSELYGIIGKIKAAGYLGIDFFFCLSGFLITYLGFQERADKGNFQLKNFLVRRAFRIWPLYFLITFLGFVIVPQIAAYVGITVALPDFIYYLFFLANFYIDQFGAEFLFFLVFLWSISVEEQFYILWSIVLKWLYKYFWWVSIFLLAVHIAFRAYALGFDIGVYFNSLNYIPHFVFGAVAAKLSFEKYNEFEQLIKISKWQIAMVYVFGLFLIVVRESLFKDGQMFIAQQLIMAMFFTFIILEQSFFEHSFFKFRKLGFLQYAGKISYGLYCYHGIVITCMIKCISYYSISETPLLVYLINPLICLVLSFVIAHFSYQVFEKYFLKLKENFR